MADSSEIKNYRSADVLKKSFNAQTTSLEHIVKELIKDKYQGDTIGGSVPLLGIVVEVINNYVSNDSNLINLYGESALINAYRVYIPTIHAGLGPKIITEKPLNLEDEAAIRKFALDSQKIKSFPIIKPFFPDESSAQTFNVGDNVYVMFQNSRTYENGYILGGIKGNSYGGTEGASTGDTIEPPPSNNQPQSAVETTKPTYQTGEQNSERYPAGMDKNNYRWLIDYSSIIDMMVLSKGYPYRYTTYPSWNSVDVKDANCPSDALKLSGQAYKQYAANNPNANSVQGYSGMEKGLDCSSYVRKALPFLSYLNDEGKKLFYSLYYPDYVSKNFASIVAIQSFKGGPTKLGDQLPGDIIIMDKGPNTRGHIVMCISYPDPAKSNESYFWGANGRGPPCDANVPHSCIGSGKFSTKIDDPNPFQDLFKPIVPSAYASKTYSRVIYLRVNPKYVKPEYKDRFTNNGNISANATPEQNKEAYKSMLKNSNLCWPKQYKYSTEINKHSPDFEQSPDLYRAERERMIATAKLIKAGKQPNDYYSKRIQSGMANNRFS